jgi:hypothetical protein
VATTDLAVGGGKWAAFVLTSLAKIRNVACASAGDEITLPEIVTITVVLAEPIPVPFALVKVDLDGRGGRVHLPLHKHGPI